MVCPNCGHDTGDSARCASCGFEAGEGGVREMSPMERAGYRGVTIDADGGREHEAPFGSGAGRTRVFVEGIQMRHTGTWLDALMENRWLLRLVVGAIAAVAAVLLVFVALPVTLMVVGAAIWLLLGLFP